MKRLLKRLTRGRPLFGVLPVLALVAALAVAGCGGSSGSGETSTESTSSSGTAAAPQESGPGGFQISEEDKQCLKEQGLELPGRPPGGEGPPAGFGGGKPPAGGPGGAGGGKFREAFEACGIEKPSGGPGGPGGGGAPPNVNSTAFKKAVTEYVACVRENGYDMPAPNLSGNGPVFDSSEVNPENAKFKAASEKCQSLLRSPASEGGETS
ncbi:MAG: hypothetical protein QOI84_2054 [Solirubrobacterales bacterium]|nr:hypothetical protein [Solirubrobacterales bacterium]